MLSYENKRPCVSLDVSKSSSHVQCFYSAGEKQSDVEVIEHNKSGFNRLGELIKNLENETNRRSMIVFESTGAYSRPVEDYLKSINRKYILIPPLLSAKVRKSDIRPTKTDKKDCETIANVYFLKKLKEADYINPIYSRLRTLSSYYLSVLNRIVYLKTKYKQFLSIVYPLIEKYFNVYSFSFLDLILHNPNPIKLQRRSYNSLYNTLIKYDYNGEIKSRNYACCLKEYFDNAAINIQDNDAAIDVLSSITKTLKEELIRQNNLLEEICLLGMKTDEYRYIITIPGVTKQTAARISAEICGIGRFASSSKFVAYIGIDPMVHSSGQVTGEHLSITHKGNQRLRCLLYLICSGTSKSKSKINPIRDFIIKKKNDGLSPKAAIIAGCNKLARIIFAVCSKREAFKY